MKCRHCGQPVTLDFLDLGEAPPSNAYLTAEELAKPEARYPLRVKVCEACWLVQTEDFARRDELFAADYAYFSSTSRSWLDHAARYSARMIGQLGLDADSLVIEVASNDGYLLRNFVAAGIPCLGIEPTASTAAAAEAMGIPVLREFFGDSLGQQLARQHRQADLLVGNNVFAHVPDINDFTLGLAAALKPDGTLTLEFPHVMRLVESCQFDTVYHEHFSYLSLFTTQRIFETAGLKVFDVEKLETHGGSLRVFGCHRRDAREPGTRVHAVLEDEERAGLRRPETYRAFQQRADRIARDFAAFLGLQQASGKVVGAYGAAAKGNTLMNYAGVTAGQLALVADASAAKQGKYLPGSHVPIVPEAALRALRPDYIVLFPWNLRQELVAQLAYSREWGARFVVAVPALEVIA